MHPLLFGPAFEESQGSVSYLKKSPCLKGEGMHSAVGLLDLISVLKCSSISIRADIEQFCYGPWADFCGTVCVTARVTAFKKNPTHARNSCCRAIVNLYVDLNLLPVVAKSVAFVSNRHTRGGSKEAD